MSKLLLVNLVIIMMSISAANAIGGVGGLGGGGGVVGAGGKKGAGLVAGFKKGKG